MKQRRIHSIHSTAVTAPGDTDGDSVWQKLMPASRFSGRSGQGPFDTGDRRRMERIVAATLKRGAGTELVVDYDHQSVHASRVGGRASAAGWIKEEQVRDDGIWGRIKWTEAATKAIRSDEYRYISPFFLADPRSGNVLLMINLALTNTPDLDLVQVAASSAFHLSTELEPDMDEILKALGLSDDSNEEAVLAAVNTLLSNATAMATALCLGKDASQKDVLAAADSAAAALKAMSAIGKSVKVEKDATPDTVVAAVASAIAANGSDSGDEPDPSKFVPIAQFQELSSPVAELRGERAGNKAETAVETAISAGKVTPGQKDWALKYAKSDLQGFEDYAASAPVVVEPLQIPAGKKSAADTAVTNNESDATVMSRKAGFSGRLACRINKLWVAQDHSGSSYC